jgi:uncharacterized protein (TIGR02466 family)
MRVRAWFPTLIYSAPLARRGWVRFNADLLAECLRLREFDREGVRWSRANYPGGFTSYGSMDKLHKFSSTFAELERRVDRHARAFAKALDFDLAGRALVMTDCWVNIMPRQAAHSLHLHPLSTVSGTYYVRVPRGAPGLRFEDPRLSRFMAAPPRKSECRETSQPHIVYPARPGEVILFESWLRHEVPANPVRAERVSVSFNYNWF